jgi:hypothetical protein
MVEKGNCYISCTNKAMGNGEWVKVLVTVENIATNTSVLNNVQIGEGEDHTILA